MSYYAIETHYLEPTDSRGARIIAQWDRERLTISYPYELDGERCHRVAADAIIARRNAEMLARHPDDRPWRIAGYGATTRGYVYTVELAPDA